MAKRIKGITIELDGETNGLESALKDVNKKSMDLQDELKDVQKLLKFDPGNTVAIGQKQELLAKQVSNTADKLGQLKDAQEEVEKQFKSGKIDGEQYKAFRREIEFTEGSLGKLKNQLEFIDKEQEAVGKSTKRLDTLFEATKSSVDDYADVLGIKLTRAIKEGKASSKQLEQALGKIGKESLGVKIDVEKMKIALDSVDDGKSLKNVRKDLKKVSKEAQETKDSLKDMGGELAGALAAGAGIGGAVSQALDFSNLDTQIDISFNIPSDSKKAVKDAIKSIGTYGIEAEEALEGVRRQWALNSDASDTANAKTAKGAAAITKAYSELDFVEVIQEANEIAGALNISNDEAIGLADSLFGLGFPPDQLDIIAEYGTQLERAGYSAEEVQAIMAAGVSVDSWNIDVLLDGIKEGRILAAEFGQEVPKSLKEAIKGTELSAKQFSKWGKAVAKGGKGGSKAMQEIAGALDNVKDETKKNAIGVAVFGTLYEENGQDIIDTLLNAKGATVDLKEGQQAVNDTIKKLDSSPAVAMKQAITDLKVSLAPLLVIIADIISKIAEWVSNNPELAGTILAVVTVIGVLIGIFLVLSPIIMSIIALAGTLGVTVGAVALPILIVIGVIAALIAIGVLLWQNWDTIKTKAAEIWNGLGEFFTVFFAFLKGLFNNALDWIDEKTNGRFKSVTDAIRKFMNMAGDIIDDVWGFIERTFGNAIDFIVALVTGDFEGMKDAIDEQMGNIEDLIKKIWGNVEDFFGDIDLKQIGIDIILGLVNGMDDAKDWVIEKAKEIALSIKDTLMFWTDSHSPSRMAMKVGGFVGDGLAIGMDNTLSTIKDSAKRMALLSIPNVPKTTTSTFNANSEQTSSSQGSINNLDFARMFEGANFHVRGERDIQELAKLLNDYITESARGGGVIIP